MNLLLVTTDQHKAATIGAYGDPLGATPALDALAAAGTTFTRCRTQNPFCQPACATILTGVHPSTHGVVRNGIDLPEEAVTESIATRLGTSGWTTAFFGKAHFASYWPDFPSGRPESVADSALVPADWSGPYFGFEHAELKPDTHNIRIAPQAGQWNWGFGPPPMGLHYARFLFRDGRDRGLERLRLMQPEAAGRRWDHTQTWRNQLPEEDHPTTWTADRAVEWIRAVDTSRPFFAWVSFADPHHPFDPPVPWCDRYEAADMREVLPVAHPEEFTTKPPMHEAWSRGFAGTPYEVHVGPRRLPGRPPDDAERADPLRGVGTRFPRRAGRALLLGRRERRPRRDDRPRADIPHRGRAPRPRRARGATAARRTPRPRAHRGRHGARLPTVAHAHDEMRHDLGRELPRVCGAG